MFELCSLVFLLVLYHMLQTFMESLSLNRFCSNKLSQPRKTASVIQTSPCPYKGKTLTKIKKNYKLFNFFYLYGCRKWETIMPELCLDNAALVWRSDMGQDGWHWQWESSILIRYKMANIECPRNPKTYTVISCYITFLAGCYSCMIPYQMALRLEARVIIVISLCVCT